MKRILFVLGVLEDEDVDWLVSSGHRRELDQTEVLIREGERCSAIYLILTGQLTVSVARPEQTAIAWLSSGEVVGEMSFIDHLPPSATVTATESPTVVLEIPGDALRSKLEQDLGFASRFYRALAILLSTRLRGTVRHLEAEYWRPIAISEDDCSPDMADYVTLGGIRYDWMMRRLKDVDVSNWESLS